MEWKETYVGFFEASVGQLHLHCYSNAAGWHVSANLRGCDISATDADAAKREAVRLVRQWCNDILADLEG